MTKALLIALAIAASGCSSRGTFPTPFPGRDRVTSVSAQIFESREGGEAVRPFAVPADRIDEITRFFQDCDPASGVKVEDVPIGEVIFEMASGRTVACKFYFSMGKLRFTSGNVWYIQRFEDVHGKDGDDFDHSEATYLERVIRSARHQLSAGGG